jgi:hypothetical protein
MFLLSTHWTRKIIFWVWGEYVLQIVLGFQQYYICNLYIFFFCFLLYWSLNSGCTPWATPPALFCDGFFRDRVSWTIFPSWLQTLILLISASWVVWITGVSHCHLVWHFLTLHYCDSSDKYQLTTLIPTVCLFTPPYLSPSKLARGLHILNLNLACVHLFTSLSLSFPSIS